MREREPDGVGAHEAGRSGPEKREAGQDGMRGGGLVSNGTVLSFFCYDLTGRHPEKSSREPQILRESGETERQSAA